MKKWLALFGFILLILPREALADGMIIIDPRPGPMPPIEWFPLEVRYHHVSTVITGNVAETAIDQMFYNPTGRDLEGTYFFPIPDDAAISEFSMFVQGEELLGEVKNADEARAIYENYVRQKIDPALLEYVGQDLFKARIYPIEANSEKRVTLGYTQELTLESGIYKYVYPLNTEKFSSTDLDEVTVEVEINSTQPIKSIYSPSHIITIRREGNTKAFVSYTETQVRPSTDFVLYYTVSDEPFGADVMTFDEQGQKYFMLLLAPDYESDTVQIQPKDIVFVLDHSGSMAGDKLTQAKGALDFALAHLNSSDRFNIVVFSDDVEVFKPGELVGASPEQITEARTFAASIADAGGTDIYTALDTSMGLLKSDSRSQMVIFLTDGLPTVGTTDIDRIISNTLTKNTMQARLFTFGVGYDVNTNLLDKLSNQNNAVSEYVLPDESIEAKVSSFYSKIANPVLSDVTLNWDSGLHATELYPREVPDFFRGSQQVVIGKYTEDMSAGLVLSGRVGDEQKDFAYRLDFDSRDSKNYFIPRLWATRRIGDLMDAIRLNGEEQELVDEIIRLSKRYGIITQYTSFLVDLDMNQTEDQLLQESRGFWTQSKAAYDFSSQTGSAAVNNAQGTQGMAQQLNAAAPSAIAADEATNQRIQQKNDKTFYLQNDTWIDNDFVADDAIAIQQYSDAYFDLIGADPVMGDYLSLGGNVQVNFGGKNYAVSATGETTIDDGDLPSGTDEDTLTAIDISWYVAGAVVAGIVGYGALLFVRRKPGKDQPEESGTKK